MSCMCGDICCPSCGPAQGNSRCMLCGEWVSEGCVHIGEDGNYLPEFDDAVEQAIKAESEILAMMAEDFLNDDKLAEEYWSSPDSKD